MIIATKKEEVKFKPCTLSITFESEEELEMMRKMFCYDIGIPELVYKGDEFHKANLSKNMFEIHAKLLDFYFTR